MNGYAVALFLHVVGALGLFVAIGLEWAGLRQMGGAVPPDQIRAWMGILKGARGVGFASMLTTVVTGFYMMATVWGGVAWLFVTMGSVVLVIALTQAVTAPRMAAIGQALAAGKGSLSRDVHDLANHPLLWISIQVRVAVALGIVFLKIAKPDWGWSLFTIAMAIVLGIVSAMPVARREGTHAASAEWTGSVRDGS